MTPALQRLKRNAGGAGADARPILLVEDNPVDVDLARRAFARSKIPNPILVARDGEEALAWVPRWESGDRLPLVVLLDLKMPKVDGLDVLRVFKRHSVCHAVPVVVLTSSQEEGDVAAAYRLGANSYIVKPVDFEEFMDMAGLIELYWCLRNEPSR